MLLLILKLIQCQKINILFSLIIVNNHGYSKTIKNFLRQNKRKSEVILINATNNEKANIIRSVLRKKQISSTTTLNQGIARARGEYISIIFDSDKLDKNYLRYMLPALRRNPSLLLCPYERIQLRKWMKSLLRLEV